MAVYTEELATDITSYPNIHVYRQLEDGIQYGWRITVEEGYVMYDSASEDTEIDPDTMELVEVIYYHTVAYLPMRTDIDNLTWIAVQGSSVEEESGGLSATHNDYREALREFGVNI